ncbi:MAG: UDP-3-O-acyl-N-acetylglucosamine deacetylase [Elusimicrobiales bacterium]
MRNTLSETVRFSGIGLHTGAPVSLEIRPSSVCGVRFFGADGKMAEASLKNVKSTVRGTNLSADGLEIFTAEHVLSALAGYGVDDADIHMTGPEPPAMDGSALAFAEAVMRAGLSPREAAPPPELKLSKPVEYRAGDVFYRAEPAAKTEFVFTYVSPHPLIGEQMAVFFPSPRAYLAEIAPARTFGYEEEVAALRKAGLARGGSPQNAVIITKDGFIAEGGLRFRDEFARHKILDMIGDFSLMGARLSGVKLTAVRGGHGHNVKFAQMLLEAI